MSEKAFAVAVLVCWVCGWALCLWAHVHRCRENGHRVSLWRAALLAAALVVLWPVRLPYIPIGRGEC